MLNFSSEARFNLQQTNDDTASFRRFSCLSCFEK